MSKNVEHIQHIKSNVVDNGIPKLPSPSALTEGEIAINYAEGYETISIKNSSGDVVTFSSDNYFISKNGGFKRVTNPTADTNVGLVNSLLPENSYNTNIGKYSVIEGYSCSAVADYSHAEGYGCSVSGINSHAEGTNTHAIGSAGSHAEGQGTTASGASSHAEGAGTFSIGYYSHAEGQNTHASGNVSHAEGNGTFSIGSSSHAEGQHTTASGDSSHAEGYYTETKNQSEHASGQYNVSSSASTTFGDSGNTLFSVGNGTSTSERHNAFEVRQNGDIYITKGGTDILLQDSLSGVVDQVIDSGTSASTNAVSTSAVYGFVTSHTPSITVDQVLDNTTSASTNPVSSKAVYDAVTDNELVWTMAYTTLSGAVSSHTVNENIHLIEGDRAKLNSIVSPFGTMAYEDKNSYSSSTDVNTALSNKSDINHTHEANNITAMTGYQIASSSASVLTTDSLLEVIGKLEKRIEMLESAMGGMTLMKVTQAEYDALTVKDQNTMYIIND